MDLTLNQHWVEKTFLFINFRMIPLDQVGDIHWPSEARYGHTFPIGSI